MLSLDHPSKPTDWKPIQGKNRRISALQVHRSRLCWVYQVLQQEEKGDEGVDSTICMQLNPCRQFRSTTRSNNGIFFTQSETFRGETRTARKKSSPIVGEP